jgi:Zn-dependent protease with chaperone function
VRLDTANRSFAGLLAGSLLAGMLIFCAAVGCVLVALLVARVSDDGLDGLGGAWPALVFILLASSGAAVGVWSLVRQARASRRLVRHVEQLRLPVTDALGQASERAGVAGRVALVDSAERFSFAYGAFAPRVVVSRGLLEAASPSELEAVLVHERYHVRNLDPLKVLLARALPATFYYLPALRSLHARYIAGRELAADRRAIDRLGRKPLAGALFKVVRGPAWPELNTAAAIGGPELLDVRIAQLETGREPPLATPSGRLVLASLAGAALLTGLFLVAVISFGGPSAVARATGVSFGPLDAAGAVLCATPWAVGLWLGYRWLSERTRRPLDTTTGA